MARKRSKIEHHYDPIADVLYVNLLTNDDEPTYTESIDDLLYIEMGWFSNMPKGFRIMSPKANNAQVIINVIEKQYKKVIEHRRKELKHEENDFSDAMKQNWAAMVGSAMAQS